MTTQFPVDADNDGDRLIFVTSSAYDGDLGGRSGADALCQTHAEGAKLQGTFLAWLSNAGADAADRMNDGAPWYDTNGVLVFNNAANLRTTPQSDIDHDEFGDFVGLDVPYWTGTRGDGTRDDEHCDSWTSTNKPGSYVIYGRTSDRSLEPDDVAGCHMEYPLVCLEQ